jgi:hypothetical protein
VAGAVGAAIGAVAGGYAGKGIAEEIDPTVEEAFWREEYPHREYYREDVDFEQIAPAYRYGWESHARYGNRSWDEVERELEHDWRNSSSVSSLRWPQARPAMRDAWDRVGRRGR